MIVIILASAVTITILILLFIFDFGPGWGTKIKQWYHQVIRNITLSIGGFFHNLGRKASSRCWKEDQKVWERAIEYNDLLEENIF